MIQDEKLTVETNFDTTELGVFINDGHFGPFSINKEIYQKIFSELLEGNFDIYGRIENDALLKFQKTETGIAYTVEYSIDDQDLISEILDCGEYISSDSEGEIYDFNGNYYSVSYVVDDKYFSDWTKWSMKIDEEFEKFCENQNINSNYDESGELYDFFSENVLPQLNLEEPRESDYDHYYNAFRLNKIEETSTFFENNVFVLRPYYLGISDEIAEKPNFEYKPTDFKLKCYKYFTRGVTCNKEITKNDFKDIVKNCISSLQ